MPGTDWWLHTWLAVDQDREFEEVVRFEFPAEVRHQPVCFSRCIIFVRRPDNVRQMRFARWRSFFQLITPANPRFDDVSSMMPFGKSSRSRS